MASPCLDLMDHLQVHGLQEQLGPHLHPPFSAAASNDGVPLEGATPMMRVWEVVFTPSSISGQRCYTHDAVRTTRARQHISSRPCILSSVYQRLDCPSS